MHLFNDELDYSIIIPARYKSSRFPGKPLALINGKPLVQHVWEICIHAVGVSKVFIATDDERIKNCAENFGANVVMTSDTCLTGTDRVAEAAKTLKIRNVVNIQGDEPLVNPVDIRYLINEHKKNPNWILNATCKIKEEEYRSLSVPKVVFNQHNGQLLYMSRAPIPHNKSGSFNWGYKQVCIYIFNESHLSDFTRVEQKSELEAEEDIEILRFLELGINVKMVEIKSSSAAVDEPKDIQIVEELLNDRKI